VVAAIAFRQPGRPRRHDRSHGRPAGNQAADAPGRLEASRDAQPAAC
jgi:hypothetical protein